MVARLEVAPESRTLVGLRAVVQGLHCRSEELRDREAEYDHDEWNPRYPTSSKDLFDFWLNLQRSLAQRLRLPTSQCELVAAISTVFLPARLKLAIRRWYILLTSRITRYLPSHY